MTLRDIGLWIRSARTDAVLARHQRNSTAQDSFDAVYRTRNDPWGAAQACYSYQRLKYDAILSMLPPGRYSSALDVGCGLGMFTSRLASIADKVLGVDISTVAVEQARARSSHSNVTFERADLLAIGSPGSTFDLIVLADVLYYLPSHTNDEISAVAARATELLNTGGILLLANHCFFNFDRASKLVRRIHAIFRAAASVAVIREEWHPFYLTTILRKG